MTTLLRSQQAQWAGLGPLTRPTGETQTVPGCQSQQSCERGSAHVEGGPYVKDDTTRESAILLRSQSGHNQIPCPIYRLLPFWPTGVFYNDETSYLL
jgi:hypothetical protein